jgi:hypothetical protein
MQFEIVASKKSALVCILSERRFAVEVERVFITRTETFRELVNMNDTHTGLITLVNAFNQSFYSNTNSTTVYS